MDQLKKTGQGQNAEHMTVFVASADRVTKTVVIRTH
jgi:hypothetical protein